MIESSEKMDRRTGRGSINREQVGRPRSKTPKPGELVNVAFKLDGALVAQLDAEAERLSSEKPGLRITRTDVVRIALFEYMSKRTKK